MADMRSLVYGSLTQDLTSPLYRVRTIQEFGRDEVLISPSLDPYLQVIQAKNIVSSGKSLALESGALGTRNKSWRG